MSQSAVSRCFKPGASVSKKMRQRVMRSVEELGYQPNAIARGLITRRSNIVAVLVSNLAVYPEVLAALSREFSERGVRVLLFTLNRESDVHDIIQQVLQYQVDGVVSAAHLDRDEVDVFSRRGIPVLFFNRAYEDREMSSVRCDQVGGERLLVEGLVAGGHCKRFAVLRGPEDSVVGTQRARGAIDTLKRLGIRSVQLEDGDYSYDAGQAAAGRLLTARTPPDCIICANDMMAFGVLDHARFTLGLKVPRQLSVVGFDGARPARWDSYALTTIRQPVDQMAAAAVDMLLARIEEPELGAEQRLFPGELVAGKTARLK